MKQSITDLVSEFLMGIFPQGLGERIINLGYFLLWTLLIIQILVLIPKSYMFLALPLISYILVILSIENTTSFKCVFSRSLIWAGYVMCLQAIAWYFIKDTVYLSKWGYLIAESFVLVTASACVNTLLYWFLVRYQVQLKLKPIIKYLITVER